MFRQLNEADRILDEMKNKMKLLKVFNNLFIFSNARDRRFSCRFAIEMIQPNIDLQLPSCKGK